MPKVKSCISHNLKNLVNDFGSDIFSTDGEILFCKICGTKVAAEKRFTVQQHITRQKHIRGLDQMNSKKQRLLQLEPEVICNFSAELCEALISANIPLRKLMNTKFKSFLEVYTGKIIPDESTLRKNYVKVCYEKTMERIRVAICECKIWVSIDSTIDVEGRHIANVIIGTLQFDSKSTIFLLNSEELETSNHSTICKLFDKSMHLLWPHGVHHDNVLLFLTDAAPYMIKAGNGIKCLYTKMVHVTCMAHGLHRVAEEIRSNYPNVDLLVSSLKKVFRKSPARIQQFKALAPHLSLPPQPILTRWGTWLNAVDYCCCNFEILHYVVMNLNDDESNCVKVAKGCLSSNNIQNDLAYIKSSFGFLPDIILKLEQRGQTLNYYLNLLDSVDESLKCNAGNIGQIIYSKYIKVVNKNIGLRNINIIRNILSGVSDNLTNLDYDLNQSDMCHFKYAPITSVDVERSFSRYKNVLTNNRRSFVFHNIRMILMVYCNNAED